MLRIELFVLSSIVLTTVAGMLEIEKRQNMWVTWANQTGQDPFCLSLATPSSPFGTCLIGVPLQSMTEFKNWTHTKIYPNLTEAWNAWCNKPTKSSSTGFVNWCEAHKISESGLGAQAVAVAQNLKLISIEPQEFGLLGSVPGNYCFMFRNVRYPRVADTWVSPKSPLYYNYSEYCSNWTHLITPWKTTTRKLPPGIFLICGNRAWCEMPQRAAGGPCCFGKLTLFPPSIHQISTLSQTPRRSKRSAIELDPSCKDTVSSWGRPTVIVSSIFAPGAASAQALTQLRTLACWTAKQINITSNILSKLAADIKDIRHAVLQNRAAIDFILLAQGHGCEEFEDMCCMNLSDHSQSIYKQLAQLKNNMGKIVIVSTPFDKWLTSWGFTGWIKDLVHFGILLFVVIIAILIIVLCLLACVGKIVSCAFASVWMVQNEEEGFIAEFLKKGGHDFYLDCNM